MAVLTRINKQGKREFKVRYFWKDAEGRTKDSKTGWFESVEEAEAEANRLKTEKQDNAKDRLGSKRQQTIGQVYAEWLIYLKQRAERSTTENTTSDKATYNRARTIYNLHSPKDVLAIRVADIRESDFRSWVKYIDDLELSGRTVRNYKATLAKFNWYLGNNGYYADSELDERISVSLSRVKLKERDKGERENRRVPTLDDIDRIVSYYSSFDAGTFFHIYWGTLFKVLFFSGVRVSELIGLTWESVDFDEGMLDIRNAISERELKKNVDARMREEKYRLKNKRTGRRIPIFDVYYQDLYDYRIEFKRHFNITEQMMKSRYVFPLVLSTKEDVDDYQKQKNILRELDRVCHLADVEKTDVQMFRHGAATWMCKSEQSGGLGFSEQEAKDYFGHVGDDMLREVYSKLSKSEKTNRMEERYSRLRSSRRPTESKEVRKEKILSKIAIDPENDRETIDTLKQERIRDQIKRCLEQKATYEFWYEDASAVFEVVDSYLDMGIKIYELIPILMDTGESKINITSIFKPNN